MKRGIVQLGGKDIEARESSRPLKHDFGYCQAGGPLVLSRGLNPHEQRRYFIHEAMHLQFWFLSEDVVDAASDELNDALDKLEIEG
jgi:hypothetical protein